jgi:uncharacterized membrane protein (UPF0127 family)
MKKIIWVLIGIVFLVSLYYWKNPLGTRLKLKGEVFLVELALSGSEHEKGLSGRTELGQNRGMLFLFGQPGAYHFWMQGMKFPLDFIWIHGKTIVDVDENVPPPVGGEPPIELSASEPVDQVLEVNAGIINRLKISVGDTIEFVK